MPHVTVNNARLWYDVVGEGEPLLLHHGYTASRVNWMPIAERLKSRYQVILMECRGTGESEHTADGYTLEQYAADVIGVADHLGLEQFTYAGHSMGGGIGYVLALTYPERLKRLVLMAAIPADGIPAELPIVPQPSAADHDTLLARYQAQRFRPEVETDDWFEDRIRHVTTVSNGHHQDGARAMRTLKAGSRLGEITMPTLILAGSADILLAANLADFQRLPNAILHVFSRAGHEVAIHEPDGVAEAIDGFMQHGVITGRTLIDRVIAAGLT
ncbi:MAG TPA: alpha/beta hydrolase [Tepidiformaceae bacterium]|nr:alpha/beta hydrolase [Tepidiformaceae bacterium]